MMALLSFLVMFQYANAASNNIYVDQIGDGSNISITQTGSGNQVGSANNRATLNGIITTLQYSRLVTPTSRTSMFKAMEQQSHHQLLVTPTKALLIVLDVLARL